MIELRHQVRLAAVPVEVSDRLTGIAYGDSDGSLQDHVLGWNQRLSLKVKSL